MDSDVAQLRIAQRIFSTRVRFKGVVNAFATSGAVARASLAPYLAYAENHVANESAIKPGVDDDNG